MNKSESIKNLAAALIHFHTMVENLEKDAQNPFFKSKYCTLDNIINTIEPAMNVSELTFAQFPSGEHGLTTILMHASGEWMESEYFMKPTKDDPQGSGSVITYQRRYALAAVLGLAVDTDDDGNAASKPETKAASNGAANDKPWLDPDTNDYNNAVNKLVLGKITIDEIRKYYKLSRTVQESLLAAINHENIKS